MGHVGSKTRSPGQILEKPCLHCCVATFFVQYSFKVAQNVCLRNILDEFENRSCWVNSRSLGQILEKPCVSCRGHIFSPILLKFSKNVCPNDILDQFEYVLCWLKN